jgi:hypothetical protein
MIAGAEVASDSPGSATDPLPEPEEAAAAARWLGD